MQANVGFSRAFTGAATALFLGAASLALAAPGTVYLVVGSDTAVWNVAGGVDVTQYHGHFLPDLYIFPQNNGYKVMDPAFRNRFHDSFGQPLKLTWWMLVGSVYGLADNTDVPIPNLMPLYLMQKYHGDAMRQFGDEVSLHYHTFFWSDYNGDGTYYWNQARTFHESRPDFDLALAQSLLEGEVFPVSFRSGWHYMDNEWQSYLNLLLPFSMHNASPRINADNVEPYDNVYDWSKAPLTFVPYHPATTNYQIPGDGIGWNVRSLKIPEVTQTIMNQMFGQAAGGTDQVACIWAHLPEIDFLTNVAKIDAFARVATNNYPTVRFRYCTAVEAMQRWLGTTDQTPPELTVSPVVQGDVVTLNINTSEPIWQPQPFVAVKDICEQYRIVPCSPAGPNSWTATLPVPQSDLAKVGVAVTDLAGNLTTRVIRYLADDVFIDNLDPQYLELSGNWSATTNAAWGIDARMARLAAGDTAQVRWSLPVTNSGAYKLFVQVPAVTNAATNLSFILYANGSNIFSIASPGALPPKQWVYLGTPVLDYRATNMLEMRVSGSNQPNTFAVADVVKLSPLVPQSGLVNGIRVESDVTTASITWTSRLPTPTLVEYGPALSYGSFSATNSLLVTNHVVTLSGLSSNTAYYFQIDAAAGVVPCAAQGSFSTARSISNVVTTPLFDLTNVWKFATNNLDAVNWRAPAYNDSAWLSGPGVFWVDTKYPTAGNADIQFLPLHTQMPTNRSTAHPFITYYFRTHFNCTNSLVGGTLTFTNYIDDGAAFYLNGVEINRVFLAAGATNSSYATNYYCTSGDATCPYAFSVSGNQLTNLVYGDNVLAVEVHNYSVGSLDVTFGAAASYNRPFTPMPQLKMLTSGRLVSLYWLGSGFTLQQASQLGPATSDWMDVPGPVTTSPYTITNAVAGSLNRFYRIRGP